MEQQLKEIKDEMKELNGRIGRITFHLFNDDGAGMEGAIKKGETNEKRIDKLETEARVKKASGAVWGSIGGGLILLARELILVLKHA